MAQCRLWLDFVVRTDYLCVLIHFRIKGEVGTVKHVKALQYKLWTYIYIYTGAEPEALSCWSPPLKAEQYGYCFVCLPGVSWLLCGSSSRCHGFVCSLWVWYFLIILTYYFKRYLTSYFTFQLANNKAADQTARSAPLLFASNKVRVSRVETHTMLKPMLSGLCLTTRLQLYSEKCEISYCYG